MGMLDTNNYMTRCAAPILHSPISSFLTKQMKIPVWGDKKNSVSQSIVLYGRSQERILGKCDYTHTA